MRRRILGSLGVGLPLAALLAACASPGTELDLTAHLAPESAAGDFKLFAVADGTERRLETLRVEPRTEGRYEVGEFRLDGKPVGGTEAVVLPGRELAVLVSRSGPLTVSWKPPGLVRPLRVSVGGTHKARARGHAEEHGSYVGPATEWARGTLMGFGPCETPVAAYPDAARFEESITFRVEDEARRRTLEVQVEGEACYAPGLGLVAATERVRTFVNGSLLRDSGEVYWYLVSGTILGVAIP